MLSSLAEELAAWVIIQEAKRHLEDETDEEVEDAFDAFIDTYFEDTDFEYLYVDAYILDNNRQIYHPIRLKKPRGTLDKPIQKSTKIVQFSPFNAVT